MTLLLAVVILFVGICIGFVGGIVWLIMFGKDDAV